jgi:hypothetical protein
MPEGPFPKLRIRLSGFGVMLAALVLCHVVNAPGMIGVAREGEHATNRLPDR